MAGSGWANFVLPLVPGSEGGSCWGLASLGRMGSVTILAVGWLSAGVRKVPGPCLSSFSNM